MKKVMLGNVKTLKLQSLHMSDQDGFVQSLPCQEVTVST